MGEGGHRLLSVRGVADAGWLYGAHVARYVSPLLLYPVLTRRLGLDGFGVYAAGIALALIVAVVVDYGLSISGPRDIAGSVEGLLFSRIAAGVGRSALI